MSRFEVSRTTTVQAGPARLHALIEDFREWTTWSPWEDVDPAVQRSYTGPDKGVGAHYEWSGNRKAGQGGMEATWRMTGEQRGVAALFASVFPMDRLVGKDFEKGLARLKAVAEHPA